MNIKKKQITSPTKITVKQSPMIARLGPQEIIASDTSLKLYEDGEDSKKNIKWQKNSGKNILFDQKRAKSPQSQQYNIMGKKSPVAAKSPRDNYIQKDINLKKSDVPLNYKEIQSNFNQNRFNNPQQKYYGQEYAENGPLQQDPLGSSDENERQSGQLVQKQVTFANADVYIGNWRGKQMEPYGVYNFTKQNMQYRGSFKKSKPHGTGTLLRKPPTGQSNQEKIYEGEWMNGDKHGQGKYYYFKDVYYEGNWVRNKKQGQGLFSSTQGDYQGQWKNDKKHGRGVLRLKNGHTFDGTWVEDKFVEGTLIHSNGDRYQGDFNDFNRHGYGFYEYSNKSKYKGMWQNNQKNGQGQLSYFNGDSYSGTFIKNRRGGQQSQYKWQSGEQIICQFDNDMPLRGKIRLPSQGQFEFNLAK